MKMISGLGRMIGLEKERWGGDTRVSFCEFVLLISYSLSS